MEYNTQREALLLPEYGRNVQRMVSDLVLEPDRGVRTRRARMVMRVMLALVPNLRSQEDHERRVWDHLCLLAGGSLDVDLPYPAPVAAEGHRPEPLPYPIRDAGADHYGRIARGMLSVLGAGERFDLATSQGLARRVANQMKRGYLQWNSGSVSDEEILADALRMCGSAELVGSHTRLVDGAQAAPARRNGQRAKHPSGSGGQGPATRGARRHRRGKGGRVG